MKKILSSLVLTILVVSSSFAQTNEPLFFENIVLVKYENQDVIAKTTTQQNVEAQVNDLIGEFGSSEIVPLWKPEFSSQLQNTFIQKGKFVAEASEISDDLERIFEIRFSTDIDPIMLSRKLASIPGIEYAEPRYIRKVDLVPNDPITNWYNSMHNFFDAWDITTGSSDVVIGIIDSGVNYEHQDLKNKMWINEDEIPENQVDDDGNGFIDDYLGWDFWESGLTLPVEVDNDPNAENNDHGTHVAGIAAADTDNGVGLSGTGFNSRIMAIKAGGIADDPTTTDVDESRFIGFGYDGILYGVLNGADVLNNSWGGGGLSQAEQDVIDFAVDAGVVVISSSGNESTTEAAAPAGYDGVLSVGSIDTDTTMSDFSNYGYSVDVFAIGSGVNSTAEFDTSTYGFKSGTSMASPVVAGLAALIRAENPDWSPQRIIHQIRNTSIPLNMNVDPLLLGQGRIDAVAALTTPVPGISLRTSNFTDRNSESLSVGESGIMTATIKNFGAQVSNLTVTLTTLQENITITTGTAMVGSLGTDESAEVEFEFDIPSDFNLSIAPTFVVTFEDPGLDYSDYAVTQYENLGFGVTSVNNVTVSFSANGTIGFSDPFTGSGGIGFIPNGFSNILYEGGIIMREGGSTNPFDPADPVLANNVRNNAGTYDTDFTSSTAYTVSVPGEVSDADGFGSFKNNGAASLRNIDVDFSTYAFSDEDVQNVVYTQYEITNTSDEIMEDFYMGTFTDWDVNDFSNNSTGYNQSDNFLYIYDQTPDNGYPYVAIAAMQTTSSNLAINNGYDGNESSYQFNIYDGYSDTEKGNSLIAGTNQTAVSGGDVSTVVASGPYVIHPGVTISLGYIYAYGLTTSELAGYIQSAKARNVFNVDEPGTYTSTELENDLPTVTSLYQNYPNPFNPSTQIKFDLSEAGDVELTVFNILGQKVQTLVSQPMAAGSYSINFNANNLSNGMYIAVLKTNQVSRTIKMTLIK